MKILVACLGNHLFHGIVCLNVERSITSPPFSLLIVNEKVEFESLYSVLTLYMFTCWGLR